MRKTGCFLTGAFLICVFLFAAVWLLTQGRGGAVITVTAPPGYTLDTRRDGPQEVEWHLQKSEPGYTAKASLKVWVESPLVPMTWVRDTKTLLSAYKQRAAEDKRKNPKGMTVSDDLKVTLNETQFVGFHTKEARPNAFVVIHYAAFEIRGRHYNGSMVARFADKRPDPAKVKIAAAEWRKILSSVQ